MPMNPRLLRPIASGVHPEANAWRTAVVANGGSVSAATMRAVSKFCADIDKAGIRDRFYRLNLFAGTGLNACLVPLYRGPSRTGTQYGNTTDTNNNFVSGDYVESAGLTGTGNNGVQAGNSKHLRTGLTPANVGLNSGHMASYIFGLDQTAPSQSGIVAIRENSISMRWWLDYRQAIMVAEYSQNLFTNFANPATATNSLVTFSRENVSSAFYYRNGAQVGSEITTTVSPATSTRDWPVFGTLVDNAMTGYAPFRMGGYSIGAGFTAQQQADYYAAMQAFQDAMGRS